MKHLLEQSTFVRLFPVCMYLRLLPILSRHVFPFLYHVILPIVALVCSFWDWV